MSSAVPAPNTPAEGPRARSRARRSDAPSKGDRTEAAIIEAAHELLAHEPVSAITVERVASMVGVSRPTVYFYFDSREAILRTVVRRFMAELETAVLDVMPPTGELPAIVDAVIAALVAFSREHARAVRSLFAVQDTDPALVEIVDGSISRISTALGDRIEAERRRGAAPEGPAPQRLAAALVLMVVRTGAMSETAGRTDWSADAIVRDLGLIWTRAIFVAGP